MASTPDHVKTQILSQYESVKALGIVEAARQLGVPKSTLQGWVKSGLPIIETHAFPELPEDDLPVEEIIALRAREFEQKKRREEATKLIPIQIKLRGPIGILHFGDPHLDDDGTDIAEAFRHAELTRTVDGLFGANLGDTTNNWVGRLARLYADQNMGRKRAVKVAEHFIKSARWLYIIAGNHDLWSGADDPIKWIAGGCNSFYAPSEIRCELRFPKGDPFRINARHDFAGSSQWNPVHALMKAFQMGFRDHLFVAGHKHESGYGMLKDCDSGIAGQMVRVASYKIYDRYAKERGFRDNSFGPACVTVIQPELPDTNPDRCKVFWDVDEGIDFLKYKRRGY